MYNHTLMLRDKVTGFHVEIDGFHREFASQI